MPKTKFKRNIHNLLLQELPEENKCIDLSDLPEYALKTKLIIFALSFQLHSAFSFIHPFSLLYLHYPFQLLNLFNLFLFFFSPNVMLVNIQLLLFYFPFVFLFVCLFFFCIHYLIPYFYVL